MTPMDHSNSDHQFEAYADGLLSAAERRDFEVTLRDDQQRRRELELQHRVDEALGRLFATRHAAPEHVDDVSRGVVIADSGGQPARTMSRRLGWLVGLAAAAAIIGVLAHSWPRGNGQLRPHFSTTPLVELYQLAIENGFEPYYECRDPERFKAVFARRQDTRLQLLPLPAGTRMLGLSYPGGLSRDTTAMLCEVDDQPVVVFVDRRSADGNIARQQGDNVQKLHIHREVRDGLVFYEVSPFDRPRVVDYLVPAPAS